MTLEESVWVCARRCFTLVQQVGVWRSTLRLHEIERKKKKKHPNYFTRRLSKKNENKLYPVPSISQVNLVIPVKVLTFSTRRPKRPSRPETKLIMPFFAALPS